MRGNAGEQGRQDAGGGYAKHTDISCRALLTAASCRIWLRMAVLGSEEEERSKELPMESMVTDLYPCLSFNDTSLMLLLEIGSLTL